MANTAIALLPTTTITTAATVTGDAYVLGPRDADGLIVESIFDYGSGGTTAKVFVQTSLDGGTTWIDIISHAFLLADLSKVSAVSTTIAPSSQAFAPSDGALADNTVVNGVLSDRIRVKLVTTGTYAGGTTIAVWASLRGVRR
jgi:hypothetical protein